MKRRTVPVVLGAAAVTGYALWRRSDRVRPDKVGPLYIEACAEYGQNHGAGNLLGIQPYMVPYDYASRDTFYAKLDGYLAEAQTRGWLTPQTIVVFPEFVGTWLVLQGEKTAAFIESTSTEALKHVVLANLPSFLPRLLLAPADDRVKYALFRMKAPTMAAAYHDVFSSLALRYGVTIVAGSIVLPAPEIADGALRTHNGPLYNVSVVYRPDGTPHAPLVRKAYPTPEETPFIAAGNEVDLPVFDTPAGKLGVLICADSWFPRPYQVLKERGVELIAVPSYATGDNHWHKTWGGYMRGTPAPDDVPAEDATKLTSGEAWLKHAMAGRMASSGARAGINVFLRGCTWDLGADGHTIMATVDGEGRQHVLEGDHIEGAALANLWL